jgi:CrcB protein
MMAKLLMIALGGAVGSLLRYGIAGLVQRLTGGTFPAGTLAVNIIGCLAIGIVGGWLTGPYILRDEYRVLILVGLLGSFTTFSTFGWETLELLNEHQFLRAGANVLLHNGLGLAGVWIGYRLATRWIESGAI